MEVSCGSQLLWALGKAELLDESLLSKAPGPDSREEAACHTVPWTLWDTHMLTDAAKVCLTFQRPGESD